MKINPAGSKRFSLVARGAWILALALVAGPGAWAQQNQPPVSQDTQQHQQDQQAAPQDAQQEQQNPDANRATNGDQRRVISRDTLPGSRADQDGANEGQRRDNRPSGGAQRGAQGATARAVPEALTLSEGTVVHVRTNDYLSSDHSEVGQRFTAVLEQPLVVNGWVVARRGDTIEGQVQAAKKAGRVKGVSQLELQLTDLTLVDGQVVPVQTELWRGSGGTSHGADGATIATTTGLGAAIGAAANEGTGAAVGAGAGLLTGIGAVLLTRGRPTIVEPETPLTFRLTEAVTITTGESKQAYLPVRQGDFENARGRRRRGGPYAVGYPVPRPYYCGYYSPCFPR